MPTKRPTNAPLTPEQVPVIFNAPVEMPSVYATNVVAQMSEFEVILSFYEAQPSFETETSGDAVRADCVAKVIIARGRYEAMANVISGIIKMAKAQEKKKK